jgi:D-serine deaminase-like pyridoxal phosphate-dependent protein
MNLGLRIDDLDTPALLLDWRAAERNLAKAVAFVADKPVRLRPHFKNHKCVTLAHRQLEAGGCVGITCAKLGEAELLVAGGIDNVLIANQVVGPIKAARLVKLAKQATIRVAVDSLENARMLSAAAAERGATIGVLVEVDIGMSRCGVPPGEPACTLAQAIADLPGLRFDGLQAYEGHAMGIKDPDERAVVSRSSMQLALDTRRRIENSGLGVAIVSGGGTGTYRTVGCMPGVNELQVGSYVTMDWSYHERVRGEFEMALSILTTVISASPDRFVLDVGVKGVGHEMGPPRVKEHPDWPIPTFGSEEHCTVRASGHGLKVGQKVELIPSHCCTTCNLYRRLVVHEDGRITDEWPIEASGALQ